ncbi:hypothetical protein GWK47_038490 [Chionoecetes opilio]|uniref:Uncharacterized protein n=1 Tax=Chionoecetes opilio TaxID=41210 RepID=A0A8J5D0X2_CHIOP|nr:hypothetical protein GWK47_038490 [Chionoecetes opilio]
MRRPGAMHSARFMASSIYLLKMQPLSSIWAMKAREQTVVEKMAQIVALLYGPYYLKSRLSTSPLATTWNSTIHSWHTSRSSPAAARKGLDSVRRHMWYLVPEQVILCLFDDMVSDKEKKKVADALVALPAPRYFARESQIPATWLLTEPATWPLSPAYQELKDLTRDMKVVNDSAERAVKDVQEYANMTRDAGHIDDVILVGIDHRCRLSHLRKADLNDII